MKKFFLAIVLLFFLPGCDVKTFEVPELTGRVVDKSGSISNSDKKEIENAILNFEKNTGGQFAVCIVPSLCNESVESASMKVAEKWKIGRKGSDNGILFFLAVNDREFRIEVGYGFEGKLNDAKAGEIGRKAIPEFKKNNWKNGIVLIVDHCSGVISGKQTAKIENEESGGINKTLVITVIVLLVLFVLLSIIDGDFSVGGGYSGGSYRSGGGYSGGGGGFGGGGFSGKF